MKKIIAYLSIITAVGGITTANAQTGRSASSTQHGIQSVQKEETVRHILNGHRGVKERRKNYRRHSDGYWYPPAAFAEVPLGKANSLDRERMPKPDRR